MRLIHYAAAPFALDRSRRYDGKSHREYFKPRGLWVSVLGEHDWPSWCEAEQWGLDTLQHATEIHLSATANILVLESSKALREFTDHYYRGESAPEVECHAIDWPRLRTVHDGIVIAPYQWDRRYDLMWYYGWDCASGCIWNLDAISHTSPAEAPTLAKIEN